MERKLRPVQEKLQTKTSDLTRSLALAEAQERSLKTNMASTDSTIRALKEQVQRMKTVTQQVRAQCANDIRKRDLEMQKLKSHLTERQRGKREGLGITTININPAVDRSSRMKLSKGGEGVNDPGYSLKQETNDFLTELLQNLSDENDALIMLARNTVQTLKDLQGLPHAEEENEGATGSASVGTHKSSQGPVTTLPSSCEDLSDQMDQVLEHLRTLLTNPSFVPLEEVEMRDEEIVRLREGWEKMEARWRQAVSMMDGWHTRIADGGGSVEAEELRLGMKLDLSVDSSRNIATDSERDTGMQSPIFEDQEAEEEEEAADQVVPVNNTDQHLNQANEKQPVREEKGQKSSNRALKERSDNIRPARPSRKVSFTPGLQGSPCDPPPGEEDETLKARAHRSEAVTRRSSRRKPGSQATSRQEVTRPSRAPPKQGDPSLTSKEQQASEPSTRLSVPQKLAAVESEARAAEQARKESESRKRSRGGKSATKASSDRRRSTLTSDELGELMGMPSR